MQDEHKALLLKIKNILKREDTVLFIGAGASQWSGLPSWPRLIEELIVFLEEQGLSAALVRKEAVAKDLLLAASYGVDQLTPQQFSTFIRKACRVGRAAPHDIHKKIVTLGPRCFITTNYDRLLEDALRQWRSDLVFRTVSNGQLTETADIVQARSADFVFKPHGDVDDVATIILTREQYRVLHGEKVSVLEAMKTLLVSRPVVFIGFGLRDVDFTYIKDILYNIYKGGACDHYAIMANVSDEERTYWKRHYGVHILPYFTTTKKDGTEDHSPLLNLLDEMLEDGSRVIETHLAAVAVSEKTALPSDQILSLARYAARLTYMTTEKVALELPILVSIEDKNERLIWLSPNIRFNNSKVDLFLENFPSNALLIGNPGAGKTYALKSYCFRLAERLRNACLSESTDLTTMPIPIYLDLKLYNGDLWRMAEQMLPKEISLEQLIASGCVNFILDAFNEMPREYFENGRYETDLTKFIELTGNCRIIIGSRTNEGLQKFNFSVFTLSAIDADFVVGYLSKRGEHIDGIFKEEVLSLLQKPLFFRLYGENKIDLKGEIHPRQLYESLFRKLSVDFEERFGGSIDLKNILAPIAYFSMDEGQEALALSDIDAQLRHHFTERNITLCDRNDLINWLISKMILVPAPGSRLAFFHQSITEYLAAMELAKIYTKTPDVLEKCLKHTRWDEALFLTVGFLNKEDADRFIKQVLETEIELAIRAAKYVEINRDAIVSKILINISSKENLEHAFHINFLIKNLPVSLSHEDMLRVLLKRRNAIGGVAAHHLMQIHGEKMKEELIQELFRYPDDYNYGSAVGQALKPYVSENDIKRIISLLNDISEKNEWDGLLEGISQILAKFDFNQILEIFTPLSQLNKRQLAILCHVLQDKEGEEVVATLIALIRDGKHEAIFPLHLNLSFRQNKISPDLFNEKLTMTLINALTDEEDGPWALCVIKFICESRSDLSELIKSVALESTGVIKLALLYCNLRYDKLTFWEELSRVADEGFPKAETEPFFLFKEFEVDWAEKESILIKLLTHKDLRFALPLLESIYMNMELTQKWQANLDHIDWWLDWLNEESSSEKKDEAFWFCYRLGHFLGNHTAIPTQVSFIEKFNQHNSPYRKVLALYDVLNRMPDLTTDSFSEDAISYLIADLSGKSIDPFYNNLLGLTATESFVQERLLPLLSIKEEPFHSNLRIILKEIGRRHRRRYISEE